MAICLASGTISKEISCSSSDSEDDDSQSMIKSGVIATAAMMPLLTNQPVKECATIIPTVAHPQNLRLSDAVSIVSKEEIAQRREALRMFSSQLSMSSSYLRSGTIVPAPAISYELTPFSSTLSSLSPICRICQCPSETSNILISPCRCDGSLKYIHGACLRKWIEVSERKHKYAGPAFCELCGYIYRRHKFFKCKDWKCPKIALRDKILHTIFLLTFFLMVGCAVATVMCFTTEREELAKVKEVHGSGAKVLTKEEIITICCGITFFISFFIAMSAELKAKNAIHHIVGRFVRRNTIWIIENYSISHDPELKISSQQNAKPVR